MRCCKKITLGSPNLRNVGKQQDPSNAKAKHHIFKELCHYWGRDGRAEIGGV